MKNIIMKTVIFISVLATVLCIWGLGIVFYDQFNASAHSHQLKQKSDKQSVHHLGYHFLALGDSLTRGTGDASGKGYIGDLMTQLKKETKQSISLTNLAINGATSDNLLKQLSEPEVQRQIKQADYIIFTIGGNDLFDGGKNLTNFSPKVINQDEVIYLDHLKKIYQLLRKENKSAIIFHVGIYNPFGALKQAQRTTSVVRKWNYDAANVAAKFPNIVYVPTFDLFQLHLNEYLYHDKFHPNSQGYQLIAKRLASLITFSKSGGSK